MEYCLAAALQDMIRLEERMLFVFSNNMPVLNRADASTPLQRCLRVPEGPVLL